MQRCCIKAVITSSLLLIGLEIVVLAILIYCHVASRPWEHKMPMFSCLLVRMGRAEAFLMDSQDKWSVGPDIVRMGRYGNVLFGVVIPREIRVGKSQRPFFFLIEQGNPPKQFFSYNDFIGHLQRLGIVSYIDFLPLNQFIDESGIVED